LKNFETIEPPTIKEALKTEKVRNKYFGRGTETLPLATFRRKIGRSEWTTRLYRPPDSAYLFDFCRSTPSCPESWRVQLQTRSTVRQRPIWMMLSAMTPRPTHRCMPGKPR